VHEFFDEGFEGVGPRQARRLRRAASVNTSIVKCGYVGWSNSMRDRSQPGLRDLRVVLRRVEARPESADHLAANDNWNPALHLSDALRDNGRNDRGCSSLRRRKVHARNIGRMVHARSG
jgi:hypothetical protein